MQAEGDGIGVFHFHSHSTTYPLPEIYKSVWGSAMLNYHHWTATVSYQMQMNLVVLWNWAQKSCILFWSSESICHMTLRSYFSFLCFIFSSCKIRITVLISLKLFETCTNPRCSFGAAQQWLRERISYNFSSICVAPGLSDYMRCLALSEGFCSCSIFSRKVNEHWSEASWDRFVFLHLSI